MKKYMVIIALVVLGIMLGFPIFSMTYYTMIRTSTPEFCASCHEIRYAYETWKTSTHVNNAQGFVADCMDCHLPAPHDTFNFFYAKTAHGIKDVFVHFTGDMSGYNHEQQKEKAYNSFKNEQCQKCHRNILNIPDKRGAMMAPDYSWWHGFYECKKRFNNFMEEARELIAHNKKAYKAEDYPNATGDTNKPKEIFPDSK